MNLINSYYNRKKIMKDNFLKSTNYFLEGNYLFDKHMNCIYRQDKATIKKVQENLQNNKSTPKYLLIKSLIRTIFFRKEIKVRNNSILFQGTVYLASNNGTEDAKIFDFINKKIMTLFSSADTFSHKVNNYEYFSSYFKVPKIQLAEKKELMIIEEMIDFIPEDKWDKNIYVDMFGELKLEYLKYYKCCKDNCCESTTYLEEVIKHSELGIENAYKMFPNLHEIGLIDKIIEVKSHGDLWSGNILVSSNDVSDYYIIDWEHSDKYFVHYDFLFFIVDEAIYNNNVSFIKEYFSGELDPYFKKVFSIFNSIYYPETKQAYLDLFFLYKYIKRGNLEHISIERDKIYQIINKMNLSNTGDKE